MPLNDENFGALGMALSVIVPGYNVPEKWWRRCVESLLRTGADEIVCVDDGSLVKPMFLNEYPVKTIFCETNGGLSAARNAALDVVHGDFVTFVDSDDEVVPDAYRQCLKQIEETNSDIALMGVRTIWVGDGLAKEDVPPSWIGGRILCPRDIKKLHDGCLLNYAWNKVYRRSFLEKNGLRFEREGMPCEDIVFNLNCVLAGAKFCMVPYVGYVYYRTRGTLLSRYKSTGRNGLMFADRMWKKYKAETPDARDVLGCLGELTEDGQLAADWRNIWLPGSPLGLVGRWRWSRQHPKIGGVSVYLKMIAFLFVRRYFYVRFLRRMHTRHLYPNVKEWHEVR